MALEGVSEQDLVFLRRAIDLAREARRDGRHPFGALIVNQRGARWLPRATTRCGLKAIRRSMPRCWRAPRRPGCCPSPNLPNARCTPARSRARCAPAQSTGRELAGWCSRWLRQACCVTPAAMRKTLRSICPAGKCSRAGRRKLRSPGRYWKKRRARCMKDSGGCRPGHCGWASVASPLLLS